MTDTQHTPGPWRVEIVYFTQTDKLGTTTICTDYDLVAELPMSDPENVNPANARLIAAAPDLLASLERLVTLMNIVGDEPFRNGVTDFTGSIDEGVVIASEWLHEARAAIAKATGQTT